MAIAKQPASLQANGTFFLIRDPEAATGSLFASYVRVPGLANFTMPNETGSSTETATLDGPVSAPAFAAVGTITGSIAARIMHPTHQFLETRKADGKNFQVRIIKPANAIGSVVQAYDSTTAGNNNLVTGTGEALGKIVPGRFTAAQAKTVLPGHIVRVTADNATIVKTSKTENDRATLANFHNYTESAASASDGYWRLVEKVDQDSKTVVFVPVLSAAQTVASGKTGQIDWRMPGLEWTDLLVSCSQFGGGDFQAGGSISSSITLTPSGSAVPTATVVTETEAELAARTGNASWLAA